MIPRLPSLCLLLMLFSMTSGCSLGPTTEVRYVLVHPGQPLKILSNVTVTGQRLDGGGTESIDVGGWVAMPPDHWTVIAGLLATIPPAHPTPQPLAPGK